MGDLLVEYLTLRSIGRETLLLHDPNFDEEAQRKELVDQSPNAFKRKNESELENVEVLYGVFWPLFWSFHQQKAYSRVFKLPTMIYQHYRPRHYLGGISLAVSHLGTSLVLDSRADHPEGVRPTGGGCPSAQ